MRKGKFEKHSSFAFNKKSLALLLALVLVVGGVVGGTLAWLVDSTTAVTNTFTTSDIGVTLEESETDFQMIPGWTIDKDPEVTVASDSVDCWLFVKVEESCTVPKDSSSSYAFGDFLTYDIAEGWTQLTQDKDGNAISDKIYYRKVDGTANTKGTAYSILKDDKVTVKGTVTKEMMNKVTQDAGTTKGNAPKLTFTAYASQLYKTNRPTGAGVTDAQITAAQFSAAEAWANVSGG